MNFAKLDLPLEQLTLICRRYQVLQLALFGSVLREDFNQHSDIDVLVEFAPTAKIGFMALGGMQQELADLFRRPVDLVPKGGLKPAIKESVLTEAKVIYAI